MSKEIYYDKSDITLEEHLASDDLFEWFKKISQHEIEGLNLLGAEIVRHPNGLVSTKHANNKFFFNRTIGVNCDNILDAVLEPLPREIVVPSFIIGGKAIESRLLSDGWVHSLSSLVLVTELRKRLEAPETPFTVLAIDNGENFEDGFRIFSSFF